MENYISYLSAAKMWDIPNIEAVLTNCEQTDLVDITVSKHTGRYRAKNKKILHASLRFHLEQ